MSYITITATLGDLAHEVNRRVQEGYLPLGGPTPGPEAYLGRQWVQAMFKQPADVPVEGTQLGDATFGEVGDRAPLIPDALNLIHKFPNEDDYRRHQHDTAKIDLVLQDPERLRAMSPTERDSLLAVSEYHLNLKLRHLRLKQQEPYTKYTEPKSTAEILAKLQENRRIGNGVLDEYFAAVRARSPNAVPAIQIDLDDARLIMEMLEEQPRAQYPTENQAAAVRLATSIAARYGYEQ